MGFGFNLEGKGSLVLVCVGFFCLFVFADATFVFLN